jgi:hypothetical protein
MRNPAPQQPLQAHRALAVEPIDDVPEVVPADPPRSVALDAVPIDEPKSVLPVGPVAEVQPAPAQGALRDTLQPFVWIYAALEWAVGIPCLLIALAVLASLPVLQFLSLGYLLEVSGRIARTAHWRETARRGRGFAGFGIFIGQLVLRFGQCFIGARKAARLGFFVAFAYLLLLPLRFVSSYALSAQLIDPDSTTARAWTAGLMALTLATAILFVPILYALLLLTRAVAAWWHGEHFILFGRLSHGGFYTEPRDAVWEFVASLRLPYYFWLGLRGFVGSLAWLVIPISLIALGRLIGQQGSDGAGGIGFLVGFAGSVQFIFVLLQLPFLQVRFAAENRFRALFEWHVVVRQFCRAPWAFGAAVLVALLFALPLYLLKIEPLFRAQTGPSGHPLLYPARLLLLDETLILVLPGLIFIVFILPARVLSGWAYARSLRRGERRRHWFFIGTAPLWTLPVVAFYVLIVFFTQYTSWNGIWSLYEQHAFLLPAPFVGM